MKSKDLKKVKWFKLIFALFFSPIVLTLLWANGLEKVVIFYLTFSTVTIAVSEKVEDYVKD